MNAASISASDSESRSPRLGVILDHVIHVICVQVVPPTIQFIVFLIREEEEDDVLQPGIRCPHWPHSNGAIRFRLGERVIVFVA